MLINMHLCIVYSPGRLRALQTAWDLMPMAFVCLDTVAPAVLVPAGLDVRGGLELTFVAAGVIGTPFGWPYSGRQHLASVSHGFALRLGCPMSSNGHDSCRQAQAVRAARFRKAQGPPFFSFVDLASDLCREDTAIGDGPRLNTGQEALPLPEENWLES